MFSPKNQHLQNDGLTLADHKGLEAYKYMVSHTDFSSWLPGSYQICSRSNLCLLVFSCLDSKRCFGVY